MKAAGTRERHIERCRYVPRKKAERAVRIVGRSQQTFKRRGDVVIVNPYVKSFIAPRDGWF